MAAAAMATGARLFNAQIAEGETMITLACIGPMELLIPLGYALGVGTMITLAIIKLFRSGRPKK
jgi:hypothetical protein